MLLNTPNMLLQEAKTRWERNAAQNRRVVLLHAVPALLLPLIVMTVNLFLDTQLDGTGGLSGIGLRSTLQTVQAVLSTALSLLLPFWQLGLIFTAMRISAGNAAGKCDLFEGFRRWGAAFRLQLCRDFRYILKMIGGVFLGSLLFSATPLSNGLMKTINAINEDPTLTSLTSEELMAHLQERISFGDLIPLYLLCTAGALIMVLPLFYRYRLSDYALLSSDKPGAFAALHESSRLMQGNRMGLFRLDLHLWWYFLLAFLCAFISYGDLILPLLGISLPFSANIATAIFALISTALQFLLYYFFRGRVETIYACVYESLRSDKKEEALC
ncbi:MAG: DUF975 family protein [Oscillospiraceae bacterium]|nr:DUF975 family protein [Oscillospiraceae bacterium]